MLFLNIATGVILVLLGMRYVRKGLDRLFGSQLVDWLQQMTNNRYKTFFGGISTTAVSNALSKGDFRTLALTVCGTTSDARIFL
jgi:phosphate:Na+ symporter